MRLILASRSKTRRDAMDSLGVKYDVVSSSIDEKSLRHDNPKELARLLAEAKAKEVGNKNPNSLVIAGDLFIVFNGKIYEKPLNKEEAIKFLRTFSGNTLEMIVGMSVYNTISREMYSTIDTSEIHFRELSDEEIANYVKTRPVTTYAAGFGPDSAEMFSRKMDSEMFLTALPIYKLRTILKENGFI